MQISFNWSSSFSQSKYIQSVFLRCLRSWTMSECPFFCCGFRGFLKNASTVYCVFCLRLILPVVFSACCTAVKLVNHITVLLFLYLVCLHYSTYWLCIINTKSTFSTEHRALFFLNESSCANCKDMVSRADTKYNSMWLHKQWRTSVLR